MAVERAAFEKNVQIHSARKKSGPRGNFVQYRPFVTD